MEEIDGGKKNHVALGCEEKKEGNGEGWAKQNKEPAKKGNTPLRRQASDRCRVCED